MRAALPSFDRNSLTIVRRSRVAELHAPAASGRVAVRRFCTNLNLCSRNPAASARSYIVSRAASDVGAGCLRT